MTPAPPLLRHFLASLAYRTQKALRGAPDDYANFRAAHHVRTPHELVLHMTSVIGYAQTFFDGGQWRPERLEPFDAEVQRFHDQLSELGRLLDARGLPEGLSAERLLQGPLSDAMTHAGQLAMLRRLAGSPVPPENFVYAEVSAENLTARQPEPAAPDPGWSPDYPSRLSGR